MTKLILVEHDHQAEDVVAKQKHLDNDCRWVALGPTAMAYLDRQGVAYDLAENFYDPAELASVCRESHARVLAVCRELDEVVLDRHADLAIPGLRPFEFHFLALSMVVDGVLGRLFKLQRIVEAHENADVVIHGGPAATFDPWYLLCSNEASLWGQVASLSCGGRPWLILPEPARKRRPSAPRAKGVRGLFANFVQSLGRRSVLGNTVLRHLQARNYSEILRLSWARSKGAVLVLNATSEWAHVVPDLLRNGWKVLFASDTLFFDLGTSNGERDEQGATDLIQRVAHSFVFEGVSFLPLIEDRLRWILRCVPAAYSALPDKIAGLKKRYDIRAVLATTGTSGMAHAVKQTARHLGVRVITWQHGFVDCQEEVTQFNDFSDLRTSDVAFVYGEAIARGYLRSTFRGNAKVIALGSASFDEIGQYAAQNGHGPQVLAGRARLLYATTAYYCNHWYFGFPPPWSDCLFYRDQLRIVAALSKLVDNSAAAAAVKLHPNPHYPEPPWTAPLRDSKKLKVIKSEKSFMDLVSESSAVILDCPSTTLLQALAARKPVFVLTRHWELSEPAQTTLAERAVCRRDADELMTLLGGFVTNGLYPADLRSSSYLKQFGTHFDDGKSAARAWDEVESCLANPV